MRKLLILLIAVACLAGCSNKYEAAVRENLDRWPYWKSSGYYIQSINDYSILGTYLIGDQRYVECSVRVRNRYDPYDYDIFDFYIHKRYPSSRTIPFCSRWFVFTKKVEKRLLSELLKKKEARNDGCVVGFSGMVNKQGGG